MGLYKSQFISMIIMIALGIGIFVGFNMEWVSIDVNTSSFFEKTNFADFRIISDSGFSEDDLNKVKDIDGVSDVSRFLSVNADVEGQNGDTVALTVTENENVSKPYLISGKEYDAKSENGVWLSDKYAAANGFELGDDITFKYKTIEISGKVEGLIKASEYLVCVRDSLQHARVCIYLPRHVRKSGKDGVLSADKHSFFPFEKRNGGKDRRCA